MAIPKMPIQPVTLRATGQPCRGEHWSRSHCVSTSHEAYHFVLQKAGLSDDNKLDSSASLVHASELSQLCAPVNCDKS